MCEKTFYRFLAASALLVGGSVGFIFGLTTADSESSRIDFGTASSEECPSDATSCQTIHQWRRSTDATSAVKPNAKSSESDDLETVRL